MRRTVWLLVTVALVVVVLALPRWMRQTQVRAQGAWDKLEGAGTASAIDRFNIGHRKAATAPAAPPRRPVSTPRASSEEERPRASKPPPEREKPEREKPRKRAKPKSDEEEEPKIASRAEDKETKPSPAASPSGPVDPARMTAEARQKELGKLATLVVADIGSEAP